MQYVYMRKGTTVDMVFRVNPKNKLDCMHAVHRAIFLGKHLLTLKTMHMGAQSPVVGRSARNIRLWDVITDVWLKKKEKKKKRGKKKSRKASLAFSYTSL